MSVDCILNLAREDTIFAYFTGDDIESRIQFRRSVDLKYLDLVICKSKPGGFITFISQVFEGEGYW